MIEFFAEYPYQAFLAESSVDTSRETLTESQLRRIAGKPQHRA
jgi:hypothetical protein